MRIAMWSGPRNLSTAMMYSFAARGDCAVLDEPFYAAYLVATGKKHPMRKEIIADQDSDPARVAALCAAPIPGGKPNLYMKHMAHHVLQSTPLDWAASCANVHLIRHPARVIASYETKNEHPTLNDIGFASQRSLIDRLGGVVIDSHDIRNDPGGMLRALCDKIGIRFVPEMLRWPAGPRPEDGIWAEHWYGSVHQSTGFAGGEGPLPKLESGLQTLCDTAMPDYEAMRTLALKPQVSG